jgi:4-alpha-glucanotransferase
VAFTGTHDNDTTAGWFHDPPTETGEHTAARRAEERARALAYLGGDGGEIHWDMIRALYESRARTVIVPLQDALGLGSEARMNRPGTVHGNWEWRCRRAALDGALAARLREAVLASARRALP